MPTIASSLLLIALVSLAPFAWFYAQNLHEALQLRDLAAHALGTVAAACLLFVALRAALGRAERATQAGDWDAAEEHLQRAVHLAESIERRWSNAELKTLSDEAAKSLDRLRNQKR